MSRHVEGEGSEIHERETQGGAGQRQWSNRGEAKLHREAVAVVERRCIRVRERTGFQATQRRGDSEYAVVSWVDGNVEIDVPFVGLKQPGDDGVAQVGTA